MSHTSVGLLIAAVAPNPWLGASAALISHYILDIVPHEPRGELFYVPAKKEDRSAEIHAKLSNRKYTSVFDLLFSLILISIYFYFNEINSVDKLTVPLLILFFSVFPDVLTLLYLKFPIKFLSIHYDFHFRIHKLLPLQMSYLTANLYQVLFSIGLLFLSLKII